MQAGGLDDLVAWQATQLSKDQQRQLQKDVVEMLNVDTPVEEIVQRVRDQMVQASLAETDVVERVRSAPACPPCGKHMPCAMHVPCCTCSCRRTVFAVG